MARSEIASPSREAYIDSGWFDCTLQTVFQSNRLYAGTRYNCSTDGASVIEALRVPSVRSCESMRNAAIKINSERFEVAEMRLLQTPVLASEKPSVVGAQQGESMEVGFD